MLVTELDGHCYAQIKSGDQYYGDNPDRIISWIVNQCENKCMVDGGCAETSDCVPTGASQVPLVLFFLGTVFVMLYRFLAGCYFKPKR